MTHCMQPVADNELQYNLSTKTRTSLSLLIQKSSVRGMFHMLNVSRTTTYHNLRRLFRSSKLPGSGPAFHIACLKLTVARRACFGDRGLTAPSRAVLERLLGTAWYLGMSLHGIPRRGMSCRKGMSCRVMSCCVVTHGSMAQHIVAYI